MSEVPRCPSECPLTETELRRLKQAALSNKNIAWVEHRAEQTVRNQFSRIGERLGVSGRTSALIIGIQKGWIRAEEAIVVYRNRGGN